MECNHFNMFKNVKLLNISNFYRLCVHYKNCLVNNKHWNFVFIFMQLQYADNLNFAESTMLFN